MILPARAGLRVLDLLDAVVLDREELVDLPHDHVVRRQPGERRGAHHHHRDVPGALAVLGHLHLQRDGDRAVRLQVADVVAGRRLGVDVGLGERQEGKDFLRFDAARLVAAEELQEAAGAPLVDEEAGAVLAVRIGLGGLGRRSA